MAELVDAQDSKSCGRKAMRVRFPPRPPTFRKIIYGAHRLPEDGYARFGTGAILRSQGHEGSIPSSPTTFQEVDRYHKIRYKADFVLIAFNAMVPEVGILLAPLPRKDFHPFVSYPRRQWGNMPRLFPQAPSTVRFLH